MRDTSIAIYIKIFVKLQFCYNFVGTSPCVITEARGCLPDSPLLIPASQSRILFEVMHNIW